MEMEVPSVKSEQIDLSTAGDELTIKIERPDVIQEDEDRHYLERGYMVWATMIAPSM
jgi:HSP20 family molecular chaperone IbpA